MNTNTAFPALLLDDAPPVSSREERTPCDHPLAGRIWNLFDVNDLQQLSIHPDEARPVIRIYDLSLIPLLKDRGLDHLPVILSHLIDLVLKSR